MNAVLKWEWKLAGGRRKEAVWRHLHGLEVGRAGPLWGPEPRGTSGFLQKKKKKEAKGDAREVGWAGGRPARPDWGAWAGRGALGDPQMLTQQLLADRTPAE